MRASIARVWIAPQCLTSLPSGHIQVILALSSIILTSQSLDTGALCLVNVDPASSRSQTCDFVYVSAPFLIVFTLTIVAAVVRRMTWEGHIW